MKKMKIALLMLLTAVLILPSCKKGENDPFMSLKSRKARLCGEWDLKEGTMTQTSGSTTVTYSFNGSTCTYSMSGTSASFAYTEKVTIDKDGTYKIETNSDGDLSTEEGAWYFGGKNKELELKDKESVVFIKTKYTSTSGGTTSTTTYSGSDCPSTTMLLDELKGKEMIMILDGSSTYTGGSSSTTGTMTFEQ